MLRADDLEQWRCLCELRDVERRALLEEAELGVTHLGSVAFAITLAQLAWDAGFDLIKLQFRTPELAVPVERACRTPYIYR